MAGLLGVRNRGGVYTPPFCFLIILNLRVESYQKIVSGLNRKNEMSRFTVGNKYPFVRVLHTYKNGNRWYIEKTDLEFHTLECVSEHEVPIEYEEDRKTQGYIFKDEKGNEWYNQYPTAHYGQLDDSGDRRVSPNFETNIPFDKMTLFSSFMDDVYRFMTGGLFSGNPSEELKKEAREDYNRYRKEFKEFGGLLYREPIAPGVGVKHHIAIMKGTPIKKVYGKKAKVSFMREEALTNLKRLNSISVREIEGKQLYKYEDVDHRMTEDQKKAWDFVMRLKVKRKKAVESITKWTKNLGLPEISDLMFYGLTVDKHYPIMNVN